MDWFRIATAGQTTDGREIAPEWIEQMAATYDPKVYGARINVEHMRGFMPDGDFGAYGDVLALKAKNVTVNGEEKLALFAQIAPNEKLKALNAQNQKIYTSVEIDTNFAKTGKAYLVGLAVTDSPASLGTEMLKFCASATVNPLAHKKQSEGNLFTAATPIDFDFSESRAGMADTIVEKIKEFFRQKEESAQAAQNTSAGADNDNAQSVDTAHADPLTIATTIAEELYSLQAKYRNEIDAKIAALGAHIDSINTKLDTTAAQSRPAATGLSDSTVIDC